LTNEKVIRGKRNS